MQEHDWKLLGEIPLHTELPDFINTGSTYETDSNCAVLLLDRAVKQNRWEERRYLVAQDGKSWSYASVMLASDRLASYMREIVGVKPRDRVLLHGFNSPQLCCAWFAIVKAGAIVITTPGALRYRELAIMFQTAGVNTVLWDARTSEDPKAIERLISPGKLLRFRTGDATDIFDLSQGHQGNFLPHKTHAEDPCLIAFTSGTTGSPKATVHFHRDVLTICDRVCRDVLCPVKTDVFVGTPPLGFTYGLGALMLFPLTVGASVIFVEEPTSDSLMDAINAHRPTIVFTSPRAYRSMCNRVELVDTNSLRMCVSAGESLPAPLHKEWRDKTGLNIVNGIGSTELLHMFLVNPQGNIKDGSVGRPVPGYEIRIVSDDGDICKNGEVGHLLVRGPTGCRYLSESRKTDYVKDGWNVTGDLASIDGDGDAFIHGRVDDMINNGGFKVDPAEVEAVISSYPLVDESAVVSVVDDTRGESIVAYVVPVNNMKCEFIISLSKYVKEHLAPYKVPRIYVICVDLPKTSTGKLQRHVLRANSLLVTPQPIPPESTSRRISAPTVLGIFGRVVNLKAVGTG